MSERCTACHKTKRGRCSACKGTSVDTEVPGKCRSCGGTGLCRFCAGTGVKLAIPQPKGIPLRLGRA